MFPRVTDFGRNSWTNIPRFSISQGEISWRHSIRLHLDNYIKELLDEYTAYATKSLRPKHMPIQPGLVLTQKDCPIFPDARKQKYYRSFVAQLQFAATGVRFDTSYSVAQLARFCASAGQSHWAALHHFDGISRSGSEFQADLLQAV
jgi:hypothetical protein